MQPRTRHTSTVARLALTNRLCMLLPARISGTIAVSEYCTYILPSTRVGTRTSQTGQLESWSMLSERSARFFLPYSYLEPFADQMLRTVYQHVRVNTSTAVVSLDIAPAFHLRGGLILQIKSRPCVAAADKSTSYMP
jgi:hypothetical protein